MAQSGPSDRGPLHPANLGSPRNSSYIFKLPIGPVTNAAGALVVGATVTLFDASTNLPIQQGVTDSTGACTFYLNNSVTCWARIYIPGSPALFATTDQTLVAG